MENQYAYEELTCEAWMEKDYTKAAAGADTEPDRANVLIKRRRMLDDLMEVNQDYWTLEKRD